jgi:hypothetical protein
MSALEQTPPEAAQLDFWIGEWDCTWEGGSGRNTVTRELGDHVILERFRANPPETFTGTSVSVFTPGLGWRQTWVDDRGSYWAFVGGMQDDSMVFATEDVEGGRAVHKRMVFSEIRPDAFIWSWERSEDAGTTWAQAWRIEYRRRGARAVPG